MSLPRVPRRVRNWKGLPSSPRCPRCGRPFVTGSGLAQHLRRVHPTMGARERSLVMDEARRSVGWPRVGTAPRGILA